MKKEAIDILTFDDFYNPNIYKTINDCKNKIDRQKIEDYLQIRAKEVGFKSFKKLLTESKKTQYIESKNNYTEFTGQPIKLISGNYECDDDGVFLNGQQIITHAIMPTKILENIETGQSKIELSFCKGGIWRSLIFDKYTLSSTREILTLANYGISVNSVNAGMLCKYLTDIEDLNTHTLPKVLSIGRLGWVNGEFSPYLDGIVFDGEVDYMRMFEAVSEKGDYELWKNAVIDKCKESEIFRFIFISSLASPLITILNTLPFIVHVWGDSGGGKTLSMMAGLSLWGNPVDLIKSYNSTNVGLELTAGFLHSLPLCLDESQMANKYNLEKDLYMLAQGQGRTRGTKNISARQIPVWKNITISTGEKPLTDDNSGAGAINRILSIESNDMIFDKTVGASFANIIKNNYGFLGKKWIDFIKTNADDIKCYFNEFAKTLTIDTTDKQRLSLAVEFTCLHFFNIMTGCDLPDFSGAFIKRHVQSNININQGVRAYEYLIDTIVINKEKFNGDNKTIEQWGRIDKSEKKCIMFKRVFNEIMSSGNFSPKQLISWMLTNGKMKEDDINKSHRFSGIVCKAIVFELDIDNNFANFDLI